MASQTVRDVNTTTSTAQEAQHPSTLAAAHERHTYVQNNGVGEYAQNNGVMATHPSEVTHPRTELPILKQDGFFGLKQVNQNEPYTSSATHHMGNSAMGTHTSTHTSTTHTSTHSSTTHTSTHPSEHTTGEFTATKPAGLKDEFVGGMKKLTGTVVCSQALKTKGEAQREKGKQEVAAAKAEKENLSPKGEAQHEKDKHLATKAQKENLSPHFAKDGNNGFLGGMEPVGAQRTADLEHRGLTGHDAQSAQHRQGDYAPASATQATSEQPPRRAHLEKTDPLNWSTQQHQDRQPLDVWHENRENTAPVVAPRTEGLPVAGHQEKSPRYVNNVALNPSPNMPRV